MSNEVEAPVSGGCYCGSVRYRSAAVPIATVICHCRSCRRLVGAQSVAWVTCARQDVHWSGDARREFESSPGIVRSFCARCGTSLTWSSASQESTIDITAASLDKPEAFAPDRETWIAHRLPWETVDARRQLDEASEHPG